MSFLELARLVARAEFRAFTESDWYAYAGCETKHPRIAEIDGRTIVIDGDNVVVMDEDTEWEQTFTVHRPVSWQFQQKSMAAA